jgi:ABC-type antimicrobial peptide transport system permease subunit
MQSKKHRPPSLFLRFFRWYCHCSLRDHIEGDLMELYNERYADSPRRANLAFVRDVLLLFRPGIIRPPQPYRYTNQFGMYKSYFKIGFRNLIKNKGYAVINIGGLAVGMTVAMLIGLWVYDELSFNTVHENHARIARVMVRGHNSSGAWVQDITAPPFGEGLRNLHGSSFKHISMASRPSNATLLYNETSVVKRGGYCEPGLPEMLTLHMLQGTRSMTAQESVLLSATTAQELFGTADPLGKIVRLANNADVVVTGVYADIPANSDFHELQWIAPWSLYLAKSDWIRKDDWRQNGFLTYVELADNASLPVVSHAIKDLELNNLKPEDAQNNPQLFLHPMDAWRLHSGFEGNTGRIQYVWLYGCIGLFVLVLACINFMNLATARSEKRAKEIGIRKSIGSLRSQLIHQFFSESLLVAGLAFILSVVLTQLALPLFASVADKKMTMPWTNLYFWFAGVAFTLLTGVLAGSYPALYLSAFKPVKALKGALAAGRAAATPRKVLVVIQFTVSVMLIVGVVVIYRQIQVGKDQPMGYDQHGLIWVDAYSKRIHDHWEAVRNDLQQSGAIIEMAESVNTPANIGFRFGGYTWPGMTPGEHTAFCTAWVGREFGKTIGWQLIAGRNFSRDIASDSAAIILNEASAKIMNMPDPIGQTIQLTLFDKTSNFTVIGIIKDMLQESPYMPVRNTVYMIDNSATGGRVVNIRLNPQQDIPTALATVETIFKKHDPDSPFVYNFVEEAYARKFTEEERIGKLAFMFAGIAIFISCLGIFGLAAFVAEQRTKEIGIRKVLGASIGSVWQLLSKDFVVLVLISSALACPLAYFGMQHWLEQFELRTTLAWYVFATAGLGALTITLLTVSYQAIRAAMANPVKSLRSE